MIHSEKNKLRLLAPAVLLLIFAAQILFVTRGGHMYGNYFDWAAQHVELPEYMRQLFYRTGKFFPDFAANLGGGQNIYYIAYYGLFSPIVLFSYLLPFVPMTAYMTASAILLTAASIVLIWRWLSSHLITKTAFAASLMFTLAVPVMFHSHHHLMFVNYLPFMILAMEGVEKYVSERKRLLLVISMFLIIMSSFFFSVGAILCLLLYRIFLYLQQDENRIRSVDLMKQMIRFAGLLIIPVMMSAVLWLPLLHVILSGRADTTVTQSLKDLIIPGFQASAFLYRINGMGLTAVFLLCVCGCAVSSSREKKMAGIFFLIMMFFGFPLFILNGGMYVQGKVLIPFLPFAALIFGGFLEDTAHHSYSIRKFIIFSAIIGPAAVLTWNGRRNLLPLFAADLLFSMAVILLMWNKCRAKSPLKDLHTGNVFIAAMLVPALLACFAVSGSDKLMKADNYPRKALGADTQILLRKAERSSKKEDGLFRTDLFYHSSITMNYVLDPGQMRSSFYSSLNDHAYHEYYYKKSGNAIRGSSNASISTSRNPLFLINMGVRYIIGYKNDAPVPKYRRIAEKGKLALYENADVLPIGYVSPSGTFRPDMKEISSKPVKDSMLSINGVKKNGSNLQFSLKKKERTRIPLPPSSKHRIIQLTMHVDNSNYKTNKPIEKKKGEVHVSVNGMLNVLSSPNWKYSNGNNDFHFTLLIEPDTDHLDFEAGRGKYKISDIHLKSLSYSRYAAWRRTVSPWRVRLKSDNVLTGNIAAKKSGLMKISIPADDGFAAFVDGQRTALRKTKEGFMAVPLDAGTHRVSWTFHAPMKRAGMTVSAAGILLLTLLAVYSRKRKKKYIKGGIQ